MTHIYGADVAELRALASFLDQSAERLHVLSGDLGRRVESSRSWSGPDADRFRTDWPGNVASPLRSASERLRDSAQALRRNADEQENASGAEASGAIAVSGAATAIAPTPLPDPRDLTVHGVNLWDLAKLAAGNVGFLEDFTAGAGIGESIGDFMHAANTGDAYGMFDYGTDVVSQTLKLGPKGLSLFGSAIEIWKFVGESAAQSDVSPEGLAMVRDFITQDPAGAAQGALDGLRANAVSIMSAVL